MPPEIESSMPTIPTSSTNTTTTSITTTNPRVPNNSFANGQHPPANTLPAGSFGLFTSCFPSIYNLFSPTIWQRNGQLTSRQTQEDINDNYEIALECIDINFKEDYIGGGNQSSVFKGKWNGRLIALKKLNRASEVDIGKLIALDHENIVKTIGICSKDIYPCIVMEYCEKGSLFDVLNKEYVGKHKFLRWAKEIASGMQYLHSEFRIIHRDLKSPNVLVDGRDTLKICDFGSLYTCNQTFMQSAVMSCVGTPSWASPELLKSEKCCEKLDVWSYGVILWEMLVQEIPYKNITSMAIVFGVGSDKLRLHIPHTFPDTLKLLLKICFAKRPRNRPSFNSIISHLTNLEVEIQSINDDAWRMRKEAWRKEVNDQAEKLRQNSLNGNNDQELNQEQLDDLVKKRMNELRHASELRQMYQVKMDRVEKMLDSLTHLIQDANLHERELRERERAGTVVPNQCTYYASPPNKHGSVPELKSVKVKKSMVTSVKGKKTSTDVYHRHGQHAVIAMEVEDNNNDEESDESLYESDAEEAERVANRSDPNMCHISNDHLPNIPSTLSSPPMQERLIDGGSMVTTPKRRVSQTMSISSSDDEHYVAVPRSRHSYVATSHQNSFEECSNSKFSSRATSARSSMNLAQRQLAADGRANRNSISHLPPYEHVDEQQFICPCCQYEFKRNTHLRFSGMSADSGVASTLDDRQMSALTLASTCNDECLCAQKLGGPNSDLYRNQQARWSDGRIHRHYHQRNLSQTPVLRSQHHSNRRQTNPFNRNSSARRVASANTTKRHRSSANRNSTGCLDMAIKNNDLPVNPQTIMAGSSNSQPKLSNNKCEEDEDVEMLQHIESGLFMNAIQEMESSSSTKKSMIMDQSSSTMASSLERSLELTIADGLSDKESKLKSAKSAYRTHRRCLSNPTNTINKIIESTTESDNDPVYC